MNDNIIQYVIPKHTEIAFGILPHERHLVLKLLAGSAVFDIGKGKVLDLPLGREFEPPTWECLTPRLKTSTGCNFIFQGNHYVYGAVTKMNEGEKTMNFFSISFSGDSFVLNLRGEVQLQIIANQLNTDSSLTISSTNGKSNINGHPITDKIQCLPPCSSFVVKSSNDQFYGVSVRGTGRRITISPLDAIAVSGMLSLHEYLNSQRTRAEKYQCNVLVMGSTGVDTTSYCQFLLNKAIDDEMIPAYVDLDVTQNLNGFPGSISLMDIKDRLHESIGFQYSLIRTLQFGSRDITESNIHHYYLLIRRMGELLAAHHKHQAGAVVNMNGPLRRNASVISCILQSFNIKMAVFIGDQTDYEALEKCVKQISETELRFISRPLNIEPVSEYQETLKCVKAAKRYFYGSLSPDVNPLNYAREKLQNVNIYRFVNQKPDRELVDSKITDLEIVHVPWECSLERLILAVSEASTVDDNLLLAEVKYFVSVLTVNMTKEIVTFMSPSQESLCGAILIMGSLKNV